MVIYTLSINAHLSDMNSHSHLHTEYPLGWHLLHPIPPMPQMQQCVHPLDVNRIHALSSFLNIAPRLQPPSFSKQQNHVRDEMIEQEQPQTTLHQLQM